MSNDLWALFDILFEFMFVILVDHVFESFFEGLQMAFFIDSGSILASMSVPFSQPFVNMLMVCRSARHAVNSIKNPPTTTNTTTGGGDHGGGPKGPGPKGPGTKGPGTKGPGTKIEIQIPR